MGTKSIFNKDPKINYTNADIDRNHPAGPNSKLKAASKYFPPLGIPGVWQGDLLFIPGDLKSATIDGETQVVFTPNTITYAVPDGSKLANRIKGSKIGVVWHTKYSGKTMESMTASFGANAGELNNTRNVWSTDATFKDTSGKVTFTTAESKQFQGLLNMAKGSLKKAGPYLNTLVKTRNDLAVSSRLKIFLNTYIRGGEQIRDTKNVLIRFEKYYETVLQKKVDSVKSEKAKKKWTDVKKIGLKELRSNKTSSVSYTHLTLPTILLV